jgi:hypothetical protein
MARPCQDPTITARHPPPGAWRGDVRPGHPRAGQLLAGRYRLRQPVAHAAAGAVWRAYDELLAREVAVKQLADQHSRGLVEARVAARVRHPSVATVHDAIRHEDSDWLVMDYHRGGTLADLLYRRRRLPCLLRRPPGAAAECPAGQGTRSPAVPQGHSRGADRRLSDPRRPTSLDRGRRAIGPAAVTVAVTTARVGSRLDRERKSPPRPNVVAEKGNRCSAVAGAATAAA